MKYRCGDLRKDPLAKIWGSGEFSAFRAIRFSDLRICKSCELLSYCDRCPGIAALEDGDILGPSSAACRMAEIRKEVVDSTIKY